MPKIGGDARSTRVEEIRLRLRRAALDPMAVVLLVVGVSIAIYVTLAVLTGHRHLSLPDVAITLMAIGMGLDGLLRGRRRLLAAVGSCLSILGVFFLASHIGRPWSWLLLAVVVSAKVWCLVLDCRRPQT